MISFSCDETRAHNEPQRFYAVVEIATGCQVYLGDSLIAAATAWVAGTCHGQGDTSKDALTWARWNARQIREAEGKIRSSKSEIPNKSQIQN